MITRLSPFLTGDTRPLTPTERQQNLSELSFADSLSEGNTDDAKFVERLPGEFAERLPVRRLRPARLRAL
jgi:hypothetical protein